MCGFNTGKTACGAQVAGIPGDSHVHLHTGGPIDVTVQDALVAARAEGLNYVNLCVSNNVGDDIRDKAMITGTPAIRN